MSCFDNVLWKIAIDHAKLGIDDGITVIVAVDHGGLELARTGEDRAQILPRQPAALGIGAVEDKKAVAPGRDAALDAEEVAERCAAFNHRCLPIVVLMAWIDRPFSRPAQVIE